MSCHKPTPHRTLCLKLTSKLTLGLISTTLSALALGCEPPPPPPEASGASAKTYRVDLPKLLDLEALMPDLKHPDGSYRVDGLLMRFEDHLDEELEITGYVTEVSPICRPTKRQKVVRCPHPHVWIADALGESALKLRVADLKTRDLRRFKKGLLYKFKGTFKTSSTSGYLSSDGLLSYQSYTLIKE